MPHRIDHPHVGPVSAAVIGRRCGSLLRGIAVGLGALIVVSVITAGGASAQREDPCDLAVTFICRLIPMAPDLDEDLDLTQNPPPVEPARPSDLGPTQANGCVEACP